MIPFLLQGPAGATLNFSSLIGELWAPLNARSEADAVYWTTEELFGYIDEAAKRLARLCPLFVEYNTSLSSVLSQGNYTLPGRHIATLQCDLEGRYLRARTVPDVEAEDSAWTATTGKPMAFLEDTRGFDQLGLYPAPNASFAGLPIGLVVSRAPDTIAPSSGTLYAPAVLVDYFFFAALAQARAKESQASMDETAQWFRRLTGTYERAITELWGADGIA